MAWIAALIGAVGSGLAASGQRKSSKDASSAQALELAKLQGLSRQYQPYTALGRKAALSLGELMGLEGYRTAEEQALTKFLRTKPTRPGETPWQSKADSLTNSITGHPMYQEDRKSGLYGLSVGLSGIS